MKLHSAVQIHELESDQSESFVRERARHHQQHPPGKSSKKQHHHKQHRRDTDSALGIECLDDTVSSEAYEGLSSPGIKFCSRSEAICAELLLRYVPHFELREGVTFQVAIGKDAQGNILAVDFLVDGVLFEYHPVRLFKSRRRCGDFNTKREYRSYADICHTLDGEQREFFQSAMKSRLTKNYYAKRRAMLDQHPMYRRMELVVASSPEEFYYLILRRFGKNVPRTVERFVAIFEELRESLPPND